MNEIKVISKSNLLGKEINVYGTAEEPLFLAKDVATWIEHSDVHKMVASIDEEEKVRNIVPTLGGNQEAWFLTEDGLYEVLMQSRKPIAKQFKKGVKKILKEIRKTGSYSVRPKPKDNVDAGLAWVEGCRRLLNLSDASTLLLMEAVARPLGLPVPDYVASKGVTHSSEEMQNREKYQASEYEDGDVLFVETERSKFVIISKLNDTYKTLFYVCYNLTFKRFALPSNKAVCRDTRIKTLRRATETEKKQLFDALEKGGKRWNPETKAIEDLPKKHEFKTFDKVLVRDSKDERWRPAFFASFDEHCIHDYAYGLVGDPEGVFCKYCIPYNDQTAHLLGTTDDWKGGEE